MLFKTGNINVPTAFLPRKIQLGDLICDIALVQRAEIHLSLIDLARSILLRPTSKGRSTA